MGKVFLGYPKCTYFSEPFVKGIVKKIKPAEGLNACQPVLIIGVTCLHAVRNPNAEQIHAGADDIARRGGQQQSEIA